MEETREYSPLVEDVDMVLSITAALQSSDLYESIPQDAMERHQSPVNKVIEISDSPTLAPRSLVESSSSPVMIASIGLVSSDSPVVANKRATSRRPSTLFSELEDLTIMKAVKNPRYRSSNTDAILYTRISHELLPKFTAKQIRTRFCRNLDPRLSSAVWTPSEDEMLKSAVAQHGFKWCRIAEQVFMNTRSDSNLYYRYKTVTRELRITHVNRAGKANNSKRRDPLPKKQVRKSNSNNNIAAVATRVIGEQQNINNNYVLIGEEADDDNCSVINVETAVSREKGASVAVDGCEGEEVSNGTYVHTTVQDLRVAQQSEKVVDALLLQQSAVGGSFRFFGEVQVEEQQKFNHAYTLAQQGEKTAENQILSEDSRECQQNGSMIGLHLLPHDDNLYPSEYNDELLVSWFACL